MGIQNYNKELILDYQKHSYKNLFSPEQYRNYKLIVANSDYLPLKVDFNIARKIYLSIEILKKFVKIFIIIGTFYLLFFKFKEQKIDSEYIIMTIGALFILILIILIPFASIDYNLERTYQQLLVLQSLPALIGGLLIFRIVTKKDKISNFIILIVFILYFLFHSGLLIQLIGGTDGFTQLNNSGTDFERFYTHNSEIKSIHWLLEHYDNKLIYSSSESKNKIQAFGKSVPMVIDIVLPFAIDKDAYVYLSYTNVTKGRDYIYTKGMSIGYNIPTTFLNENKNLIYNNGGSKIYK